MNYLKREGLGGAMVWAIDLDDYLGLCGSRWPLLSAVRRSLLTDKNPSSFPMQEHETQMNELDQMDQHKTSCMNFIYVFVVNYKLKEFLSIKFT